MSGHQNFSPGGVELICGPMFSGKTEELLRRVRLAQIARQRVQIFRSSFVDDLRHQQDMERQPELAQDVVLVEKPFGILERLYDATRVVGIDEIQHFDDTIIKVVDKLVKRDVRVICAGLDLNFSGRPFGAVPKLLALADRVDKVHAVCTICGSPASKTYCLLSDEEEHIVTGDKAFFQGHPREEMKVEDTEIFEARCNAHYDAHTD